MAITRKQCKIGTKVKVLKYNGILADGTIIDRAYDNGNLSVLVDISKHQNSEAQYWYPYTRVKQIIKDEPEVEVKSQERINIFKPLLTRSGCEVQIFKQLDDHYFGAVKTKVSGEWISTRWGLDGKNSIRAQDLIQQHETKILSVNLKSMPVVDFHGHLIRIPSSGTLSVNSVNEIVFTPSAGALFQIVVGTIDFEGNKRPKNQTYEV